MMTLQHVEEVCRMKLEVSQMRGKASLESHKAIMVKDIIQVDHDAINKLINIVTELKSEGEVQRERLQLLTQQGANLQVAALQLRLLDQTIEDHLARMEDKLNKQHQEIAIL